MKRKLHICFVSPKAYPLFNKNCNEIFGGAEVQMYLLAREFAKNKSLDVNVIVADYGQEPSEKYDGITIIKSFKFSDSSLIKNVKFLISFMRANADICIQRTLDPASGIIAILCKLLRKQFVYMVAHDGEVDGGYERNNGIVNALLANVAFKCADATIVQNTTQKDLLYTRKGRDSSLIKSGYPITNPSRASKGDYVLWVGRSEQWKRPELFIKLAERNMNIGFKMICPRAYKDYKGNYSLLKQQTKGVENLEFVEYVPFDGIGGCFQKAKVFVNTSTQEGFPNTFIQAAKNGTPIISLDVNPDNILDKYNCGFFCEGDFDRMGQRLDQLLNDANLYERMSENAYRYAKENHDIEKNAEELYRVVMDLKC